MRDIPRAATWPKYVTVSYHPILEGRVLHVMFYDGEEPPKRVEISQVDLYERVGKSVNLGTLRGLN